MDPWRGAYKSMDPRASQCCGLRPSTLSLRLCMIVGVGHRTCFPTVRENISIRNTDYNDFQPTPHNMREVRIRLIPRVGNLNSRLSLSCRLENKIALLSLTSNMWVTEIPCDWPTVNYYQLSTFWAALRWPLTYVHLYCTMFTDLNALELYLSSRPSSTTSDPTSNIVFCGTVNERWHVIHDTGHYVRTSRWRYPPHKIASSMSYFKRTVLNTYLLLVLMACLYCMGKGVVSKLFDVTEFITNLPAKDCPDCRMFASTTGTWQDCG